jgi:hypothetical protein
LFVTHLLAISCGLLEVQQGLQRRL